MHPPALSVWTAVAAVLAVAAAAPCGAHAQAGSSSTRDAEARNLFEAGRLAMNDGRFEDALAYFERAHELSGRPELLYNVATVAERLGDDTRALEALRGYLAGRPDAEDRRAVERRIELLERRLAAGDVPSAEETARAAGPGPSPAPAPLAAAPPAAPDDEGRGGLARQWWFWTIVGVVVVGGAVTAGVLLARDPGTEGPLPGTNGVVVVALGER